MDKSITAVFTGDIMTGGTLFAQDRTAGWETFRSRTRSCFEPADIVFGNLEAPLPSDGAPAKNKIVLEQSADAVEQLKASGFNGFSLANNHIMDHGEKGLSVTLEKLKSAGLLCAGAGSNLAEARVPSVFAANGMTAHVLSYAGAATELSNKLTCAGEQNSGLAPLDPSLIREDIGRSQRDGADAVIVVLHWGEELCHFPSADQVKLGRAVIDWGAALVVGHHSHILQGVERYRDGLIAYSLGNFLFGEFRMPDGRMERWQERHRLSAVLSCRLEPKKVSGFELVPLRIGEDLIPRVLEGQEKEDARQLIEAYSREFERPDYDRFWRSEVRREKLKTMLEKIKRKILRYEV